MSRAACGSCGFRGFRAFRGRPKPGQHNIAGLGSVHRTQDSELRAQDSALRTQDSGLRTQDSELRTQDLELSTQNSGLRSVRFFTRRGFYVTCDVRDADQDGGAAD